jgi:stage V sporulation protein G
MEITEVRIKLMEDSDDRLQAFCSITIDDCFVIRDLKIIEGTSGPFVAMPSRKLTSHCPQCGTKNHLRSGYCNSCGGRLKEDRTVRDQDGRAKLYADIAHPINSQCREMIQKRVIEEYRVERERAKQPDYVSRYDDTYEDEFEGSELVEEYERVTQARDATKRKNGERTQIQPAEVEPRAPHIVPAQQPAKEPPPRGNDQFGAGIFD